MNGLLCENATAFNLGDDDIKILCLDQATRTSGWSLWEDRELVDYGILDISEENIKNPITRMLKMSSLIKELLLKTKPDYVVLEDVQVQHKNYAVFGQLSQLQGVIFSLLEELNIGFEIIPATKWKSFSGIKGKKRDEQKANTIQFIKEKYNLDVSEDIADAIGIGTYFCNTYKLKNEVI